jgi:4-azaleucine resistance transporter AzlC
MVVAPANAGKGGRFQGAERRRGRISPALQPDASSLRFHPQYLAAVKACLPVLPGVLAFAAISGVAMVAAGMPHYMAMAMSVLVYAGSSQLAALQLVASGTPLAIVILAGLVINLRFSIYSLSIAPHLAAAAPRWRPLLAYLLSDNGYAMAIRGYERLQEPSGKVWYYFGCCSAIWITWQIGTFAGIVLGTRIPAGWHLEFSIVLTFLAIVAPTIRDRAVAAAACAAGITAALAWSLPLRLGLLVAVAAGMIAGMLVEQRR